MLNKIGRPAGIINATPKEIEKIINMTEMGYSRPEISKEVNRPQSTVYNIQKRFNIL